MQTNKVKCPFVISRFDCGVIEEIKPFEVRIDCYEENCPAKFYEPLKCLNPTAPTDQYRFIGGYCKYITNICEGHCPDFRKCKKTGEAKIPCRQEIIDEMFRKPSVATKGTETPRPPVATGTEILPKNPVEP
jgi:hypothetical protein